jgi:hypothetical protein
MDDMGLSKLAGRMRPIAWRNTEELIWSFMNRSKTIEAKQIAQGFQ